MSSRPEIAAQQQEYLSFLPLVRQQFGAIPGVDIIGLGAKERKGRATQEWAFRFYVQTKRPLKDIPAAERIPKSILGVKTDVIQHFEKVDLVTDPSFLVAEDETNYRDAGIRGGIQIRNEYFGNEVNSGYGTMGILARKNPGNILVGLTCAHVVNAAADTATSIGHKIGHPKYYVSCCCCPHGYIGDVLLATSNTDLDCALIQIHDDVAAKVDSFGTEHFIQGATPGSTVTTPGPKEILCFDNVTKFGRATGHTVGAVRDVAYGTNQVLVERTGGPAGAPFAAHGDSGAALLNSANEVLGIVVAADRADMTKAIVTLIKPIMQSLGITIHGKDYTQVGDPVSGGPTGCELFAWPGGQVDHALNPKEPFTSTDFGFAGAVNWDVSTGAAGAVIVEADGAPVADLATVNGATSIKVRYHTTSVSKNATDAVRVKATSGALPPATKFRTVFTFTPTVKTVGALDGDNTKRFLANGGTITNTGAAVPGTDGATHFRAKAEITYSILPADIAWSGSGAIAFVTGAQAGARGNIVSRRDTKFTRGEQAVGAPNRTHTSTDWTTPSDAVPLFELSTADNFQAPDDAHPAKIFRLSNEGIDPTNLRQCYLRALYRDYLQIHDGTEWVRITPHAEWFANFTGGLNAAAPPIVVAPNAIGAGADATVIPNQQPTIVGGAIQEVALGAGGVTITATPADLDNDLTTVHWTQVDGPAVVLSSATGTSVTFTAPGADAQLRFSVVVRDSTLGLDRNAANFESAAQIVTVNVVEINNVAWKSVLATCTTSTQDFNAASFHIGAGGLNWSVVTGGTNAVIIQSDGAPIAETGTVNGASSIRVRFDNISPGAARAQSVVIQATNPANGRVFLKRRRVTRAAVTTSAVVGAVHPTPLGPGFWGLTWPENVVVMICAERVGANWAARLITATGNFSITTRLLPGVSEVTGPGGNTNVGNYCTQMNDLNNLTHVAGSWFILAAVNAHENVHATHFAPAMTDATVIGTLQTAIDALVVPHAIGMTEATAITALRGLPAFATALTNAQSDWLNRIVVLSLANGDHSAGGPCDTAEHGVVDPMVLSICTHARANGWAACPPLCP